MKKVFLCCLFLAASNMAFGATIYLKTGTTVSGKVTEKAVDSIKVDVSGVMVTYYNDEIERIEGDETASVAPVSSVPPVVSEPVAVLQGEAPSVDKKELVLKFVDVFGTKETMQDNFDQMMASMPPDMAQKFRAAINVDDIIQGLLPLYDKYFTAEELSAYIKFYSSAEGLKLVKTIPQVMKDSIAVSEKYFEEHMPEEFKQPSAASK